MQSPSQKLRAALAWQMQQAGKLPIAFADGDVSSILEAAKAQGLSEAALCRAQAFALGAPYADSLSEFPTSSEFLNAIPIAFARQYRMLGLARAGEDDSLYVAIGSMSCWEQLEAVGRLLGRSVTPVLAPPTLLLSAINQAYQQRTGQAQEMIKTLKQDDVAEVVRQLSGREDLLDNAARAPVIKLVNLVLFEAVKTNASDVHLQPQEDRLIVRMRIDGVLYDAYTLPRNVQDEVISRIKVMGRMNIAEKRLAQDGRATAQIGDRAIDLRIATLPTSYGERVVIRLLDKSARLYELGELGMDSRTLHTFEKLITVEHGLILVTGPTGSGKSTTLYSVLNRINGKEKNILTLEDPIEYQLEGISQTQVSEKKGLTFAGGLRRVLRQDPDIIMVGEIRDLETATMAIQSSLTGHLVLSTLHTNDAASAVTRLLDLGIEPYLVASSLVGVLAQRLVRRVCSNCAKAYRPSPSELEWLGVERAATSQMQFGHGCASCRNTGYRGRLGAFELLSLNDDIRRLVQARASAAEINEVASRIGARSLRDDGIDKILAGATTIAEVERVTLRSTDQAAAETLPTESEPIA